MQKMLKTAVASLVLGLGFATAHAATPGLYVGAGVGVGKLDNFSDTTGAKAKLSGKVVAGYNFNKSVGVEAGYNQFGTTTYSIKGYPINVNAKVHTASLAVKGYVPVASQVDLYALGGVAFVTADVSNSTYHFKDSTTKPRLLLGAGVNYDISPNLSTNFEYARTQAVKDKKGIPDTNLVTVGLAYHFN